jgi:two-component system phosphate regulon sensor histidine kinase PhoR
LFLVITLLPAAALVWLGWQLVEQDRRLERQRVRDLVESTANGVIAAIERELGAIERNLGAATDATGSAPGPDAATTVRLNSGGTVAATSGSPLVYTPAPAPASQAPPDSLWAAAERLEFAEHDVAAASQAYRALARSEDPNVRAGALIRLARTLRSTGRADEALETYATLAAISGATVLGDPVDLMARWARVDLLDTLGRRDQLIAEATSLDADLRRGRWYLDRTTALTYVQALKPWRTDADEAALAGRIGVSDAVAAVWNDWQAQPSSLPPGSGRRSVRVGSDDVLVVWQASGDDVLLFAASPAYLSHRWAHILSTPNVAVALVDHEGRVVAGDVPPASSEPVVKPASDTRLPWTLRVEATSTPADIAATGAARRRIILLVLGLLAVVIPATGYVVSRAVRGELALARQRAAFVSAVSHEFRSPLTSLAHLTSLLRSDFQPTAERRRQYYDVLAHETDRLRRFVETLLDFGRIQAGATSYHLAPVDAGAVVGGVVEEFRKHVAAGVHQVSLTMAPGPLPPVSADVEALGRAVWNLLENAAKYSPAERPIVVRVEEDGGRIAIRVSDEGAGVPAAERPFIFDQFYRGAAASTSAVKGTGVGLAVVRHIVLGHGGEILVDSTVGAGSTFSIVLPAALPRSASAPERRAS